MIRPLRHIWLGAAAAGALTALWPASALAEAGPGFAHALDLHLGRILLGLAICLALTISAAFALKHQKSRLRSPRSPSALPRWLASASQRELGVLESRRLSSHAEVSRLSYRGREYLIVSSAGGAVLLKDLELADEAERCP